MLDGVMRTIRRADPLTIVFQGEIIEDYSDDKPYPSCLIYGESFSEDQIHSVWAYNQENQWAVLINPRRWIDWRRRRSEDAAIQ